VDRNEDTKDEKIQRSLQKRDAIFFFPAQHRLLGNMLTRMTEPREFS